MAKERSPHIVTFESDPEDPHFTNVLLVKKSTGEVKATHYILTSDAQQWISHYETDGFVIMKELKR